MQVSGSGNQVLSATIIDPQKIEHGPCPVCKKHLAELKLGPFIKHRQRCKGVISQREVRCLSPGRYAGKNSLPGKKVRLSPCCSKPFGNTDLLNVRLPEHTGEKNHECKQYSRHLIRKCDLTRHKCIDSRKTYECQQCDKCFSHKSHLTRHQLTHTGEKPYKCAQCNKRFSQKPSLLVHQRTHTGEKPYECRLCDKKFSQKSHLRGHQLIHTGEKPFECRICNKRFRQKHSLVTHGRIHTGEKPFVCKLCDKHFTQQSSLRVHQRIHTGEKPYDASSATKPLS